MKTLSLDFDGVLHSYSSGWKGADVIPDPPVPGAMAFLQEAAEHFKVCIFSSRSNQPGGIEAMKAWLHQHLPSVTASLIHFPTEKPPAFVGLDDRIIRFAGVWPSMESLQNFKTWQQE